MEKITWKTERRRVKDLIPYESNPRLMNEKEDKDLKESIKKFDLVEIPAVNLDNMIIAGHQRIRVLMEAGRAEEEIDVRVPSQMLTDGEFKEYLLRSNKNLGRWDWDLLANNFDEAMLLEVGFTDAEMGLINTEEIERFDIVPQINEQANIILGDIYQLGEHRLMCGDSTKKEDVMKLMNGKTAELLFTSPPYADMREYEGGKDLSINNLVNFIFLFSNHAKYQVINLGIKRQNNEIIEYWQDFILKAKDCGYKFLSWNIWNRESAKTIGQQMAFFPIAHEWIFVFGKEHKNINKTINKSEYTLRDKRRIKSKRQKNGLMEFTSVGDISNDYTEMTTVLTMQPNLGDESRHKHPATFPVSLPEEYIKAMTNFGDIVIDPFLGSGTTLIACEKTKRICFGMELEPKYMDVIIKRWEYFTNEKAVKIN